jgi:hypothetical protein
MNNYSTCSATTASCITRESISTTSTTSDS